MNSSTGRKGRRSVQTQPAVASPHLSSGDVTRIPPSRKLLATASARAASLALTAVATTLTVRYLGPGGAGVYFVLINVATTATALGHLSLEQAHVSACARGWDVRDLASNAIVIGLATGCLSALAAWSLVRLLGPGVVPLEDEYLLLAFSLLAVPAKVVVLYLSGLLALDDRIGRVNVANLLGSAIQCLLTMVLVLMGRLTSTAVIILWTAAASIPLLVLIDSFKTRLRNLSVGLARKTVALGLRYHVGMVSLFLLFRVDILLLNAQMSKAQVGLYALAVTLVELTYILSDSLAQVVLPRQVMGSLADAGVFTARVIRVNFLGAVGSLTAVLFLGPWLVPITFGEAFAGSLPAVISLAPGIVALATIRAVGGFLIRLDRPWVVSSATVAAMLVNVALNLLLIPNLGIVGSGIASSAAYIMLAVFYLGWLLRASGLATRELMPRISDIGELTGPARRRLTGWWARFSGIEPGA